MPRWVAQPSLVCVPKDEWYDDHQPLGCSIPEALKVWAPGMGDWPSSKCGILEHLLTWSPSSHPDPHSLRLGHSGLSLSEGPD